MTEPISVVRQTTFNSASTETIVSSGKENRIRRGNIELPVVEDSSKQPTAAGAWQKQAHTVLDGDSHHIHFTNEPRVPIYSKGPPSSYGDSELGILSDVGLIGDSDTETLTSANTFRPILSLSTSKKATKKEPRIKVPSTKFDSTEPTIHEERTRDILALQTPIQPKENTNTTLNGNRAEKKKTSNLSLIKDYESDKASKRHILRKPNDLNKNANPNTDEVKHPGSDISRANFTLRRATDAEKSTKAKTLQKTNLTDNTDKTLKTKSVHKIKDSTTNVKQTINDETENVDKLSKSNALQQKSKEINKKTNELAALVDAKKNNSVSQKVSFDKDVTKKSKSNKYHGYDDGDNKIDNVNTKKVDNENDELDSSFYESDWQPKSKKVPRIENVSGFVNDLLATATEADRAVISKVYENDVKPSLTPRGGLSDLREKGGLDALRPKGGLETGKRWADNPTKPVQQTPRLHSVKDTNAGSKQKERDNEKVFGRGLSKTQRQGKPSHVQTPVKLQCIESVNGHETDTGFNSDWNNDESISGVPKTVNLLSGSEEKSKSPIKQAATPRQVTPTGADNSHRDNMESDGYDYTSETFEDVLQERNAMVRSERTLQRRIKQLEEELKQVVSQSQGLSDENKELRNELEALKSKPQVAKIEGGDESSRRVTLEKENEELKQKNDILNLKIRETETKTKQFDGVFVENTKLKTKNAEMNGKIQELKKIIQNEEAGKQSKSVLEAVVTDCQNENRELQSKIRSMEEKNRSLAEGLEEKRKEVDELMHAMKTETSTEKELAESKEQLSRTIDEMDRVKSEVEAMKKSVSDSEGEKKKLEQILNHKENEIRKMKGDHENKERLIVDLRANLDKTRKESIRYQQDVEASKGLDKEVNALKSRIGSLKAEIDSSCSENQKLKHEREESYRIIEKLRQETSMTSDAMTESKRYFRKWEMEKDAKSKCEVELAKKDDDIQILESRLRDASNKMNALHGRVRNLEDERAKMDGPTFLEMQANMKIMRDENKRLRQMLVERNIELTNKTSEVKQIDSRIILLERKQKDSEIQVKQLSGWISNRDENPKAPNLNLNEVEATPLPPRRNRNNGRDPTSQSMGQSPRKMPSDQPLVKKRTKTQNSVTPPPEWQQKKASRKSEESSHTPLSLPIILDTKPRTPPDHHGGYFQMYQDKMKRLNANGRKF